MKVEDVARRVGPSVGSSVRPSIHPATQHTNQQHILMEHNPRQKEKVGCSNHCLVYFCSVSGDHGVKSVCISCPCIIELRSATLPTLNFKALLTSITNTLPTQNSIWSSRGSLKSSISFSSFHFLPLEFFNLKIYYLSK